jgi:hypothetical protein
VSGRARSVDGRHQPCSKLDEVHGPCGTLNLICHLIRSGYIGQEVVPRFVMEHGKGESADLTLTRKACARVIRCTRSCCVGVRRAKDYAAPGAA